MKQQIREGVERRRVAKRGVGTRLIAGCHAVLAMSVLQFATAATAVTDRVSGRDFGRPDAVELWDDRFFVSWAATRRGWRCVDPRSVWHTEEVSVSELLSKINTLRPRFVFCRTPPTMLSTLPNGNKQSQRQQNKRYKHDLLCLQQIALEIYYAQVVRGDDCYIELPSCYRHHHHQHPTHHDTTYHDTTDYQGEPLQDLLDNRATWVAGTPLACGKWEVCSSPEVISKVASCEEDDDRVDALITGGLSCASKCGGGAFASRGERQGVHPDIIGAAVIAGIIARSGRP